MLAPFDLLGIPQGLPNFQGQLSSKDLKRVLRDLGEELETVDFASFMKMLPALDGIMASWESNVLYGSTLISTWVDQENW